VRSPEKITRRHPRLQVVRGDPHSVHELAGVQASNLHGAEEANHDIA